MMICALLFGLILTAIAPSNQDGWLIFLAGRIVTAIAVGLMYTCNNLVDIRVAKNAESGTIIPFASKNQVVAC
jgi:hypothetical protein